MKIRTDFDLLMSFDHAMKYPANMHMCVFIYIYVCVYICIYVYVCVCVYVYICVYICIYVHIQICHVQVGFSNWACMAHKHVYVHETILYIYVCIYMFICVCVCMYICIYMCVYMYIYVCIYVYMYTYIYAMFKLVFQTGHAWHISMYMCMRPYLCRKRSHAYMRAVVYVTFMLDVLKHVYNLTYTNMQIQTHMAMTKSCEASAAFTSKIHTYAMETYIQRHT
jgi:hypothetical protein